jgi:hypothetical protein
MGRSQSAGQGFAAPRAASRHKAASKRSRLEFEASLCGVLQPFDAVKVRFLTRPMARLFKLAPGGTHKSLSILAHICMSVSS